MATAARSQTRTASSYSRTWLRVDEEMPRGGVASALVSDKDVDDIQIRLSAPFAAEVTVDWGSAQAPAAAPRRAIPLGLTPVEGQPRAIMSDPAKNAGKMNSVFPGRYRVMPNALQTGSHVAAVMWGGRDVNGQVVELTPGAAPFQVILSSEFGKVRGTVEKGEGTTVFLVSRESGEILNYRQVECKAGGAFEIVEVPPGDYYVVAFDHKGQLPAADLPAAIMPIASSVRVDAGSTASVDLKVNEWPW